MSLGGRLALMAFGTLLAVAAAEGGLRAGGFEYHLYPTVQFGWPDPVTIEQVYKSEPDLLWVERDYDAKLAAARRSHPAIVFMGDSCTEFGTYPSKTIDLLASKAPALATGVSFGVGGWSTEQGLAQLRRDVLPLHPRVVTIYYGWNDHWIALGPTDPDLTLAHRMRWLFDHFRLVQLLMKARMGVSAPMADRPNRVPIERYRANLRSMIEEARAARVRPVLVTAPSNHMRGQEPEYLRLRHLRSLTELVPLHQAYVEATRAVARDSGGTLCDVATAFDQLAPPHGAYFQKDGIHLTDAGDRELAAVLADCITGVK
jgi:lysophospholipase L1-like esterase